MILLSLGQVVVDFFFSSNRKFIRFWNKVMLFVGAELSATIVRVSITVTLIAVQVTADCLNLDKEVVFQRLRDETVQDSFCGKHAVIERKAISIPKSEVTVYAIVTNITRYTKSLKTLEIDSLSNGDFKRHRDSVKGSTTSRKRSKRQKRKSRY